MKAPGMAGNLAKLLLALQLPDPGAELPALLAAPGQGQRKNFLFPTSDFGFVCPLGAAPELADPKWIPNRWPGKSI